MSATELQKYIFKSKYSIYNKKKQRRETWEESVDRVRNMMLDKYPQISEDINWAYDMMRDQRVLGSQRAMQFGGIPALKHQARVYNCTSSYCDRLRFFQEAFYLLLCGCGTGFSVQQHHIDKLPGLSPVRISGRILPKKTFVIPDTIEGWSDSLGVLLSSYFENPVFPEYYEAEVEFDPSLIRLEGSPLSSGVGKAPGPEPLMKGLERVRVLLDRITRIEGFNRFLPIHAYDTMMYMSYYSVLAGGVRRSATIVIFDLFDKLMLQSKTGNWFSENEQRQCSNNSVMLLRNKVQFDEFSNLVSSIRQFGEPGFYFSDDTEQIPNPCCEIGMWPVDEQTGKTGWQMCNLSTVNCGRVNTEEDFLESCRAAAILGTCQAGFNKFPYLGEVTERIVKREALLGVSMTGMMRRPNISLDPKIQSNGAKIVIDTNEKLARKININPCARGTSLKPEGTGTLTLTDFDNVQLDEAGIHGSHAKRYLKLVRANKQEPIFQYFKKHNPWACIPKNDKDEFVVFCMEGAPGTITKKDLPAIEFLENVRSTYKNWIIPGKVIERCTQPYLSHNVSNTCEVADDEWDDVMKYIYDNRLDFSGITLIGKSGDKDYHHAPNCEVFTPEEVIKIYGDGALFTSGLIEEADKLFETLWCACDAVLKRTECVNDKQERWVVRAKAYAKKYFDGDETKMTYCLKDVHNWKVWIDLKRSYRPVDYEQFIEYEDNCKPNQEAACAGGQCSII